MTPEQSQRYGGLVQAITAQAASFTRSGLPIGMQVIGKPFDEETLLRVARGVERALPLAQKLPALVRT